MSYSEKWDKDPRITVCGSETQALLFFQVLESIKDGIIGKPEGDIRLILMRLPITAVTVLVNGNSVWDPDKILVNLRLILSTGKVEKMSDYLYKFLSLSCGSIAHYNKAGWVDAYPTVGHLMGFFKMNEFCERVLDYVPRWATDVREIVTQIEGILFKEYRP